jgi:hypothetical protein
MNRRWLMLGSVVLAMAAVVFAHSASAHTVTRGEAPFGCIPAQFVATSNSTLDGHGIAYATTLTWTAGLYCETVAPSGLPQTATAIRHQVWVWPGWWYDCGYSYRTGLGSSFADASYVPNPVCATETAQHRVFVSHSAWFFGHEFIDAYILYH